jgi:hypothetical protein
LIKTMNLASSGRGVVVRVEHARARKGSGRGGAEAKVRIDTLRGGTERWLLRESWWAESLPAPTYGELVSWSVRALPWSIAIHFAQRYWRAASLERMTARLSARALAFLQLFVALLCASADCRAAFVLLLGLLPIPQLRFDIAVQSASRPRSGTAGVR